MGTRNRSAASTLFNCFIQSLCCHLIWRFSSPLGLTDTKSGRKVEWSLLLTYITLFRLGAGWGWRLTFPLTLLTLPLVGELEHILTSARGKWKISFQISPLTLCQSGELEYTICFYGVGKEWCGRSLSTWPQPHWNCGVGGTVVQLMSSSRGRIFPRMFFVV